MDIYCPACQKKLQIADSYAGQMVKCPSCAGTFQAPSLPSMGSLPTPEPLAAPPHETAPLDASFSLVPDPPRPTPLKPPPGPPQPEAVVIPKGEYTRSFTVNLRQEVVRLIPPLGLVALFLLSFFPWRFAELAAPNPWATTIPMSTLHPISTLNLWELAFSTEGFTVFLFYVLLLILTAPFVFLPPFLERNLLPTPAALRPYLPWIPAVTALLTFAAWFIFLTHYIHCTFVEPINPAGLWMKVAFRLHTLILLAALVDFWLERRKHLQLPVPSIKMKW